MNTPKNSLVLITNNSIALPLENYNTFNSYFNKQRLKEIIFDTLKDKAKTKNNFSLKEVNNLTSQIRENSNLNQIDVEVIQSFPEDFYLGFNLNKEISIAFKDNPNIPKSFSLEDSNLSPERQEVLKDIIDQTFEKHLEKENVLSLNILFPQLGKRLKENQFSKLDDSLFKLAKIHYVLGYDNQNRVSIMDRSIKRTIKFLKEPPTVFLTLTEKEISDLQELYDNVLKKYKDNYIRIEDFLNFSREFNFESKSDRFQDLDFIKKVFSEILGVYQNCFILREPNEIPSYIQKKIYYYFKLNRLNQMTFSHLEEALESLKINYHDFKYPNLDSFIKDISFLNLDNTIIHFTEDKFDNLKILLYPKLSFKHLDLIKRSDLLNLIKHVFNEETWKDILLKIEKELEIDLDFTNKDLKEIIVALEIKNKRPFKELAQEFQSGNKFQLSSLFYLIDFLDTDTAIFSEDQLVDLIINLPNQLFNLFISQFRSLLTSELTAILIEKLRFELDKYNLLINLKLQNTKFNKIYKGFEEIFDNPERESFLLLIRNLPLLLDDNYYSFIENILKEESYELINNFIYYTYIIDLIKDLDILQYKELFTPEHLERIIISLEQKELDKKDLVFLSFLRDNFEIDFSETLSKKIEENISIFKEEILSKNLLELEDLLILSLVFPQERFYFNYLKNYIEDKLDHPYNWKILNKILFSNQYLLLRDLEKNQKLKKVISNQLSKFLIDTNTYSYEDLTQYVNVNDNFPYKVNSKLLANAFMLIDVGYVKNKLVLTINSKETSKEFEVLSKDDQLKINNLLKKNFKKSVITISEILNSLGNYFKKNYPKYSLEEIFNLAPLYFNMGFNIQGRTAISLTDRKRHWNFFNRKPKYIKSLNKEQLDWYVDFFENKLSQYNALDLEEIENLYDQETDSNKPNKELFLRIINETFGAPKYQSNSTKTNLKFYRPYRFSRETKEILFEIMDFLKDENNIVDARMVTDFVLDEFKLDINQYIESLTTFLSFYEEFEILDKNTILVKEPLSKKTEDLVAFIHNRNDLLRIFPFTLEYAIFKYFPNGLLLDNLVRMFKKFNYNIEISDFDRKLIQEDWKEEDLKELISNENLISKESLLKNSLSNDLISITNRLYSFSKNNELIDLFTNLILSDTTHQIRKNILSLEILNDTSNFREFLLKQRGRIKTKRNFSILARQLFFNKDLEKIHLLDELINEDQTFNNLYLQLYKAIKANQTEEIIELYLLNENNVENLLIPILDILSNESMYTNIIEILARIVEQ